MKDIQEVFNRIQEANKEKRQLKNQYKDTLANLMEYKDVLDELKRLQLKKKQIENTIQQQLSAEFTRIEALESALKGDAMLLSDLALTTLIRGEAIAVTDEANNTYEPILNVKFKKAV